MREPSLFEVLASPHGPALVEKVKTASFASNAAHAAIGAAAAAGAYYGLHRILHKDRKVDKPMLGNAAATGAVVAGLSSIGMDMAKKAAAQGRFPNAFELAVRFGKEYARVNAPELIGGAIGGIGMAAGNLAATRRWKKGKPSWAERDSKRALDEALDEQKREIKYKGKATLGNKLDVLQARTRANLAKIMIKHPVAGTISAGVLGAALGHELGGDAYWMYERLR